MKRQEFNALIKKLPDMDAGYIELPFDAEKVFGKKRVRIKVWFDGELYRGTLMRMGMDCDWIGINHEIRKKIGKNPGDTVHVIVEEDIEERTITIPEDIVFLFRKNKTEAEFFQSLSYTNQKEYVNWVVDAKHQETRDARLEKMILLLRMKKKNPSEKL